MNDMAKRSWTALNDCLVFDFVINRNPRDGDPSMAYVRCHARSDETRSIAIHAYRTTPFNFRFRSNCYAHGYLQQRDGVHVDGVDSTGIFADMYFGIAGQSNETHFEGLMVACPSHHGLPPAPPEPPGPPAPPHDDPTEPGSPLPLISGQSGELFPYVYVRRWPRISDDDLQYGFIQYTAGSPPTNAFYGDLVAARQQGLNAVELLTLSFIDGGPPYAGQFVDSTRSLSGPPRDFAHIAAELQHQTLPQEAWLSLVHQKLECLLQRWHQPASYFKSTAYVEEIDRVWQSYFAMVITLGYDPALLSALTQTLWMAHVVAQATVPATTGSNDSVMMRALMPAQVAQLRDATILLPGAVFPSPAANIAPRPSAVKGWIEPYAVGDLQMVRQRLLRYACGEVARIENVIRGERKEVSSRLARRQVDMQANHGNEGQTLQNDDVEARTSLLEEAQKTIASKSIVKDYDNFQTTYGPPTVAILNGTWTRTISPGPSPGVDDTTRFAREVLNHSINRLTRQVGTLRASSTLHQVEDATISVIDNTSGASGICAVYRWLNKVYEAYVVNYGNRLMMEFTVLRPAARYIASQAALTGERLLRPEPPQQRGICSFEDITRSNYATYGAIYGVTGLKPPPPTSRVVTTILRSGEEKQIVVPLGYCAYQAWIAWNGTIPGIPAPEVLIGREKIKLTSAGTMPIIPAPEVLIGPEHVKLTSENNKVALHGEDTTIPVSVSNIAPTLSPPTDPQVQVSIEIECTPSFYLYDEWRIGVYDAIVKAYQEQLARYHCDSAGGVTGPRSPLANRRIEQRELRDACMGLLLERAAALTGAPDVGSPPSQWLVYEPRYLQFLDTVLEWREMAYSFHCAPRAYAIDADASTAGSDGDESFIRFLQADQARVLLPVQPGHVMAFLYFFTAGMIWDGSDRQVPVYADDEALVNDLKQSMHQPHIERRIGSAWELVVPTSMQVLDGALPHTASASMLPMEDY